MGRSAGMIILTNLLLSILTAPVSSGEYDADGSRFFLEIEPGIVLQTRNDVQVPNDAEGTRFSLYDLAGNAAQPAVRVYLGWRITQKQSLRLLYAPLTIEEEVLPPESILFAGGDIPGGSPTNAVYRFNSYRVTWNYLFHSGQRSAWRIGFTAKIRDALIELEQGDTSARKTDTGFVPLLHLSGRIRLGDEYFLVTDLDALAGGPGRAEDFSLRMGREIGDRAYVSAGYRTVEGGADVDEVYTFAWLHYFVLSFGMRL